MSRVKPKKPAPSVKAPPKAKTKPPIKKPAGKVPTKENPTPPVLSSTYNCLNQEGELEFYLQEVGARTTAEPFRFLLPPRSVSWKKPVNIQEIKTQGNITQPLYFSLAENRKLSLSGIIFEAEKGSLPHERLELLQSLQLPIGTKLRVYQLLVGNKEAKQFAARSYGKFVISSVDIAEQFRDIKTGKTLRAIVNLELTEVSAQQIDLGKDLSIPSTIVPTLPQELGTSATPSINPVAASGGPSSNIIKAGTTVALVGFSGTAGKFMSHLHMGYIAPGKTLDQTVEPLFATGQLPSFVQKAISLGPFKKIEKKKLSELKSYSPIQRKRTVNGKTRAHRGCDYQLTPLSGNDMYLCPINIEVDMYFVRFFPQDIGFPTKLRVAEFECFVPGYEGIYQLLHVDGLAPGIDTTRKRTTTAEPTNKGGKTATAQKVQADLGATSLNVDNSP